MFFAKFFLNHSNPINNVFFRFLLTVYLLDFCGYLFSSPEGSVLVVSVVFCVEDHSISDTTLRTVYLLFWFFVWAFPTWGVFFSLLSWYKTCLCLTWVLIHEGYPLPSVTFCLVYFSASFSSAFTSIEPLHPNSTVFTWTFGGVRI